MSEPVVAPVPASLDPATAVGGVRLTVSDLPRARGFYERALGLSAREAEGGALVLVAGGSGGARDLPTLVELHEDRSAPPLRRSATGLFHLALLLPSRLDLAFALARLADASWPLDGASDHLVSEALYLSDPDGHGIELYRDRPREQWRVVDGQLQMATLPLDLRGLVAELPDSGGRQPQAPAQSRIGHVHLQVSELERTEAFYAGVLGFDVVVRGYPGALFVSAGGYHHHIGLNTWNSAGAGPPPPGSVGLRSFEVQLPDAQALDAVLTAVRSAGLPIAEDPDSGRPSVSDPSGNAVVLRVA